MTKSAPNARAAYRHFQRIPTRWMDNDVYGHVNKEWWKGIIPTQKCVLVF